MQITKMFSAEGEGVDFREVLYPKGNVEDWMLEIERCMKESLRLIIKDSLADYKVVSMVVCLRDAACTCDHQLILASRIRYCVKYNQYLCSERCIMQICKLLF